MCGIHLIFDNASTGKDRIKKMVEASMHRGPDQTGMEQISTKGWIGANRLKILDLSSNASQPFKSEDGNSILAWNGAIYNYAALKKELIEAGVFFKTDSDTEVLQHWLYIHGEKGLARLNGMYALVFIDFSKQAVIVSRDPTGQKPLHYFNDGNKWIFSSEARGVVAGMDREPAIDTSQFFPYFHYRFPWPDGSFYTGIRQLLPGETLVLGLEGHLLRRKVSELGDYPPDPAPDLDRILKKSVLTCFRSDRQAGMVLSGGVDSSLIYSLWYEQTGTRLPTFTTRFDTTYDKRFSDYRYAKYLAKKYPSDHQGIPVTKETIIANWKEYIACLDQPVGDGASFLTWYISKQTKSDIQLLISGAGGDELFGGYLRHKAYLQYLRGPGFTYLVAAILAAFGIESGKKITASIEQTPRDTFIQMAALHRIPKESLADFHKFFPTENGELKCALAFDRCFYLINDILKIHDNACMAHGIEGRAPFLDRDLLSFVDQLSEKETRNMLGKKSLKRMLEARGLGAIAARKKLGFGMPVQDWLRDPVFQRFIFAPIKAMEGRWGSHFTAEMRTLMRKPELILWSHTLLVWNWFVLASWLEQQKP